MDNEFTAHNILLEDGTQTMPSAGYFISQHPVFLAAKRTLHLAFPNGLKGVRLVDLGCLEGGYSVEFAKLGMDVLGIEVRESNFRNCMFAKSCLSLNNLNFVCDDACNLEKYGSFDAVLCLGLLYHLYKPVSFLGMLGNACQKVAIINSHFAPEEQSNTFSLSDFLEHDSAQGRWYVEFPPGYAEDRQKSKWSSWSNDQSFWLRKGSLLQAMRDAGFPLVFEQYDGLVPNIADEMHLGAYHTMHRSTFIGMKV